MAVLFHSGNQARLSFPLCPPLFLHQASPTAVHRSSPIPAMLPCLRRALRPALSLRAGTGLAAAGLGEHHAPAPRWPLEQRRALGTHPLNETVEPLNSPRGAKEFIYTLHPSERTCLLRELHKFESIAIAQGEYSVTHVCVITSLAVLLIC